MLLFMQLITCCSLLNTLYSSWVFLFSETLCSHAVQHRTAVYVFLSFGLNMRQTSDRSRRRSRKTQHEDTVGFPSWGMSQGHPGLQDTPPPSSHPDWERHPATAAPPWHSSLHHILYNTGNTGDEGSSFLKQSYSPEGKESRKILDWICVADTQHEKTWSGLLYF